MSEEYDENDIKEQLLDLNLDEVERRSDLLEYGVKPFLRKSNSRPNRRFTDREVIDEHQSDSIDLEQVWSRHKQQSMANILPDIVLSGRSTNHFEGEVGKIHVFNLLYEVTDEDIQILFGSFGPLKRAAINYDRNGRSNGTAFIVFNNRADSQKAFLALDGYPLDGRKLCLRLLDSTGMRGVDRNLCHKRRGDYKPIDYETVYEDRDEVKVEDLDNMDLDGYVRQRKRAKTWNYWN